MSIFNYPPNLISELKKVWERQVYGDEKIPSLPSDNILEELLEVSFHASLSREEQRRIGFRIIYATPQELKTTHPYFEENEPIRFETSFPCTPSEVLRLAPAADL